jgi:hypothetical protein
VGTCRRIGEPRPAIKARFLFSTHQQESLFFLYNAFNRHRTTSSQEYQRMGTKKSGARGKKAPILKQVQAQIPTATSEGNSGQHAGAYLDAGLEEEIRRRAYELFEARDRAEGFDQEDWNRAEAEVLSRYRSLGKQSA